ncbi:MAG: 4-hydroxy-tetrahydrodipicolinate reductase [Oscillospiraceae bacterium]|nr:4-hydroxy-tetrahydrodipicolinate reductase [Oscillospiraceae bacterium]
MKILVHGSTGRMGKILCQLLSEGYSGLELAARVSPEETSDPASGVFASLAEVNCQVDGVIDFSHHTAIGGLMDFCIANNLPVVVATTGQTPEEKDIIAEAAKKIPVFFSANMSIGVALLAELAKKAASVFPEANIEIVEKHHNQKLDVPSGTALLLAHRIQEALTDTVLLVGRHENGKRTAKEIGIHSLRLGNEVGTHEIIIATDAETITLKHEAENRSLFANGALAAAKFLEGKPAGLYSMQDII